MRAIILCLLLVATPAAAVEIIVNPYVKSEARDKLIESMEEQAKRRELQPYSNFECRSFTMGGVKHTKCEWN